jgi:hypothetical protein
MRPGSAILARSAICSILVHKIRQSGLFYPDFSADVRDQIKHSKEQDYSREKNIAPVRYSNKQLRNIPLQAIALAGSPGCRGRTIMQCSIVRLSTYGLSG